MSLIVIAVVLIAAGYALFVHSSDNFAACQSTIGGIVRMFDPGSARGCADAKNQHYGSIALMGFGAVVLLVGIFVPRRRA
jgi:hypothetical protein